MKNTTLNVTSTMQGVESCMFFPLIASDSWMWTRLHCTGARCCVAQKAFLRWLHLSQQVSRRRKQFFTDWLWMHRSSSIWPESLQQQIVAMRILASIRGPRTTAQCPSCSWSQIRRPPPINSKCHWGLVESLESHKTDIIIRTTVLDVTHLQCLS